MPDPELLQWLLARLPPAPARLLEVGAGSGELAEALRGAGFAVTAIDPGADTPAVDRVALADLDAADASFDAAVTVVSLHHVEPLAASVAALARVIRPGGILLVDEFDAAALDERAAAWLIERRGETEELDDPAELVAAVREHVHPLAAIREALAAGGFELELPARGAYLHRWNLPPGHGPEELSAIDAGEVPAVGVRFGAVRS